MIQAYLSNLAVMNCEFTLVIMMKHLILLTKILMKSVELTFALNQYLIKIHIDSKAMNFKGKIQDFLE